MYIKKLIISSFGKFTNKELDFTKGLNIISGLNEAGKSTIHKFIEGMFFGFFESGKSNRRLSKDYQLYYPRNKNQYYGSMVINHKDKDYIIERNFDKKKPTIKVLDFVTGEDITSTLDIDTALKLPDLSSFLNINATLYKNTISISQMLNETSKELAVILIEKLANMHATKDETISINKIEENINNKASAIGTKKTPTKPLGITIAKKEKLEIEYELSKSNYELLNKYSHEIRELDIEITQSEKEIDDLTKENLIYENNKLKNKYEKSSKISKEIETNKELLNELDNVKDISINDFELAKDIKREISLKQSRLKSLEEELTKTQDNDLEEGKDLLDLEEDYNNIIDSQKEIANLEKSQIYTELESKKTKFDNLSKSKPNIRLLVVFYILSLLIIGIFLLRKYNAKFKNNISEIKVLKKEVIELESKVQINNDIIEKHQIKLNVIYNKHNCETDLDFYKIRDDKRNQSIEIETSISIKKEKIRNLNGEITLIESNIINIKNKFNELLKNNNVKDFDDFVKSISLKKDLDTLNVKINSLNNTLNAYLEGDSLEELFNRIDFTNTEIISEEDVEKIVLNQEKIRELILEKNKKRVQLLEQINYIEKDHREPSVIHLELNNIKELLISMENKLQALSLTKRILKELSEEIQYEFAPTLNKEISKIIKKITNDKYNDIKLDKKIDVKMFDTTSKTFESIRSYSSGTIDQIYLAMRFGIINTITDDILPFILDDCFVNYDDERLKNVLNIIHEETEISKRQVLLFTCQNREINIYNKNKIDIVLQTI